MSRAGVGVGGFALGGEGTARFLCGLPFQRTQTNVGWVSAPPRQVVDGIHCMPDCHNRLDPVGRGMAKHAAEHPFPSSGRWREACDWFDSSSRNATMADGGDLPST